MKVEIFCEIWKKKSKIGDAYSEKSYRYFVYKKKSFIYFFHEVALTISYFLLQLVYTLQQYQ